MKRIVGVAAAAILAMAALAGCGGSKPVALHVNDDAITMDEFNDRVRNVSAAELAPALQQAPGQPRRFPGKAGEYAFQTLVATHVILQVAKEKHAVPADAEINAYLPIAKRYAGDPRLTLISPDPFRDDSDWRRVLKYELAVRNMVLQQVKPDATEIQRAYDQIKNGLGDQETFHLRIIDCRQDKARAQQALDALKKISFETVAIKYSEDPQSSGRGGDIGFVPSNAIPADLLAAVKTLKPGEYTKSVVAAKVGPPGASPNQPGVKTETRYYLAQLVEDKPPHVPSLDEVKPVAENWAIQMKDPAVFQRVQSSLRDAQLKAVVTTNIKEYQPLVDQMKRQATAAATPGTGPAPRP